MSGRRFLVLLGLVFAVALTVYLATMPSGNEIPLVGTVDGNEVVVSPQIAGRILKLMVDEGSAVKKGELIAELDPKELEAALASQDANIRTLASRVTEAERSYRLANDQTAAQLAQAQATQTASEAQLRQAQANQWRDQQDYRRTAALVKSGVFPAQNLDHAEAAVRADQAAVKALADQVEAQRAGLRLARANRKQLGVIRSQVAGAEAQLAQARAQRAQAAAQLGYTKIYAPIDGIVSVRVAKQGEVVAAGGPIVVVVDVDHLWVRAEVEETYIDAIRFGETMKVRLPSGGELEGKVFFKGVEGEFATQRDVSRTKRDIKTFAIKLWIPNPGRRLFTGMTATVLMPPPGGVRRGWRDRL